MLVVPRTWQVDQLVLDRLLSHHSQIVPDEVKCAQRVLEVLPVQVNLLCVAILVYLLVSFWHFGDKAREDISLLLFLFIGLIGLTAI